MITVLGVAVVLGVLLVARYGADSHAGPDPTGRDPMWPDGPVRHHSPREDLAALTGWARRVAAHRRCWELFDAAQRPWEAHRHGSSPDIDEGAPGIRATR